MTRAEKLRVSFDAMDLDGNGTLDFDEMLHVCRKINPGKGLAEAVPGIDRDGGGQVDQGESWASGSSLMEDLDDDVFDAGVKRVLLAVKFASASRQEKLRMVFSHVDTDGSGTLDRDELDALSRALVPGGDEEKVRRTMRWLDADGDAEVTFEEFSGPMLAATERLDDDAFDAATHALLAAEGGARNPGRGDLPPKFAAYVSAFPTHATTPQIGVKRLNALASRRKIAVVDCRPEEERAVSIIPGSIPLGDVKFADATDNNVGACMDSAVRTARRADLVVAVSSTGAEGVAATLLGEKLGVEARNLCGGMVAWFSAGGRRCATRTARRASACIERDGARGSFDRGETGSDFRRSDDEKERDGAEVVNALL